MRKMWVVLRILGILVFALLFVKNMEAVTLHLYLGYSLTLPFFLWLVLSGVVGLVLGYVVSRFQFRRWKALHSSIQNAVTTDKSAATTEEDTLSAFSLAEALRAAPAAPKGEDEHRHYGI